MSATPRNRYARGVAFAAIGATCWGFSATCIQLLVSNWAIPVEWAVAVRLAFAGPGFLILALLLNRQQLAGLIRDRHALVRMVAFGFVGVIAVQLSYFACTAWTNAGIASTLERLSLLFILGWTCLTTRRLPYPREIAGIGLALAGVALISTQGNLGSLAIPLPGLLLGIVAALSMAGYVLIPGEALERYGALSVTGAGMTLGAIVLNAVIRPWSMPVEVTPDIAWVMFLMISIGTLGAYFFYMQGIKDCGPVAAGMLACIEPVSAIVISAVWLSTPVTPWDIAGCALIISMVIIVTKSTGSGTPIRKKG